MRVLSLVALAVMASLALALTSSKAPKKATDYDSELQKFTLMPSEKSSDVPIGGQALLVRKCARR
jgi:hypothetical protein